MTEIAPTVLEEINWEGPRQRVSWDTRAQALERRPGIWAKFGPYKPNAAYALRTRLAKKYPSHTFYSQKEKNMKDVAWVYAAYTPTQIELEQKMVKGAR